MPGLQKILRFSVACLLVGLACRAAAAQSGVTPPPQPEAGPGGSDYAFPGYVFEQVGSGPGSYWLFEPRPRPAQAPVIVVLHGYSAEGRPNLYRAYLSWVEHLVRKGSVVIFPLIQNAATPQRDFYPNALRAIKDAVNTLQTQPGRVRPQTGRDGRMNFAITGHSLGAGLTYVLASLYPANGIPKPKALMPVMGGTNYRPGVAFDTRNIPPDTYLLTVSGNDDPGIGNRGHVVMMDLIRKNTPQIPADRKNWVLFYSDDHGTPPLVADHSLPAAAVTDALDYYGVWKLSQALFRYAFYGTGRDYCLGGGPDMTYLGAWSDGRPVVPPYVSDAHMDWTDRVSVTRSGLRQDGATGRFVQKVTLRNTGDRAVPGPVSLVLDDLPAGVSLYAKGGVSGVTTRDAPRNSPYLDVGPGLNAGAKVVITLEFINPANAAIRYTTRVLAGPGGR